MGRRKIEIRPIQHERNRAVTFVKRKTGLFKKAYELSVLCSIDIAVIIFEDRPNANPKCYEYSSTNVKDIVNRHIRFDGERDTKGAADFAPGSANNRHDDDDDDDDDDSFPKRSLYMKSGLPMPMTSDYPMIQPPMPIHPSLPSYPQHGLRGNPPSKKHRTGDYRPYPDPGFRGTSSGSTSSYGSSGYYGTPSSTSATTTASGNPYPGSNPGTYDYHRPSRSSSAGGMPSTGSDFRQIAPPGSAPSGTAGGAGYGGLGEHGTNHSPRGTATPNFPMDWSNDHSHTSSTGQSPAMANASLGSTAGPTGLTTHPPSNTGQDASWLNSMNFMNDSDRRLPPPDMYGSDRPVSRLMSSRSGSGGTEDSVKRETG